MDKSDEIDLCCFINHFINENSNNDNEYILNTCKLHFNKFENYLYKLALSHMNKLQIDPKYKSISFSFNKKPLHIESSSRYRPLVTILSFFETNKDNPFIITDIDEEMFKYKTFTNSKILTIFYPNKMSSISFDGGNKYFLNNKCLKINIWNRRPDFYYYIPNNCFTNHNEIDYILDLVESEITSNTIEIPILKKQEIIEEFCYQGSDLCSLINITNNIKKNNNIQILFSNNDIEKTNTNNKKEITIDKDINKKNIQTLKKLKFDPSIFDIDE